MRRIIAGLAGNAVLAIGIAGAMPPALTVDRLIEICASPTISAAAAKGAELGWPAMTGARLEEWRAAFITHNRGSVEALGWRRGERDGDGLLSFWIAQGPNRHRACSYSTGDAAGLLDALSARLGAPGSLERYDAVTTAAWRSGMAEISFAQTGSGAVVYVTYPR